MSYSKKERFARLDKLRDELIVAAEKAGARDADFIKSTRPDMSGDHYDQIKNLAAFTLLLGAAQPFLKELNDTTLKAAIGVVEGMTTLIAVMSVVNGLNNSTDENRTVN